MKSLSVAVVLGVLFLGVLKSSAAEYEWSLYDDFSSGSLDTNKWSLEVDNSSASPRVEDGRVNCSATLEDGTCKIGLLDSEAVGVKADLTLGSAVSDSGNEIEINFSNGAELWLDTGLYGTIHYISASGEYESGEEFMGNYVTNVNYDQAYELAVVITNGIVSCYVDGDLLDQYNLGSGVTATGCYIGAWSDTNNAVVEGYVDNVYVLREVTEISAAEYEWKLYDDFSSGLLDTNKWALEVENSSAEPVVEDERVSCSATLEDGTCKVELLAEDVIGVKADLTLGYADSNSGNEIEIDFSNGNELWLDIGMYGSIHYISASAEDAFGEQLMDNYVTNVNYDQAYELAVVITNGTVSCYVDDVLLGQYVGEDGLSATSCRIGAWSDTNNAVVEGYVDNVYVLREVWDVSSVIEDVEISAGYELVPSEFMVGFELEVEGGSEGAVAAVEVAAPFGSFSCEQDGGSWEYETSYSLDSIPEVDGDWTITLVHTNGSVGSTVVAFKQATGADIPDVTTCPQLTVPDFSGSDPIFAEQDVTWEWDSAFDANANEVNMGGWNELIDEDVELTFEPTSVMRSNGPLSLEAGTTEAWFANGFVASVTNEDGVLCTLIKYAGYNFEPTVVDPEWDVDQDHLSNEWEMEYFGSLTAGNPDGDADGDGVSNLAEFQAGTDPTNAASLLVLSGNIASNGFELSWTPVIGHEYNVLWSTNLMDGFTTMASGLTLPQDSYAGLLPEGEPVGFCALGVGRVFTNSAVVRQADIQVDGSADDWADLPVQFSDPIGDSSIYSGLDISGITMARGSSNLFIRVDRAGTAMPSDAACQIWVSFRSEVEGVCDYGVSCYHDERYGYSSVSLYDITGEWTQIDGSIRFDDSSSSLEFSIPLEELELVDHYAVNCYTFHSETGDWQDNGENDGNNTAAVIIFP